MSKFINPKYYDIIIEPILTEKSAVMSEAGYSCFLVKTDATKPDIKAAVEAIYKVEVAAVKTVKVTNLKSFAVGSASVVCQKHSKKHL